MRRSVSQGRGFLEPHRGRRHVPIDWADYDVKARHDKMVELVKRMLKWDKDLSEAGI